MFEPISILDAGRQIEGGQLAPIELVERCLEQIDRYEDQVHAWVVVDAEGARRRAEQLGQEVTRDRYRGALHGIPIGIKDIIDVAGFPTRAGSPLLSEDPKPDDAPLVALLREAGAIILGKTVTCEFACFDPSPTRNPWSPTLEHTPGGSSSGSAVAVALGMCLGAIGTQTGGSLVRPASYCGVSACKPNRGRVSVAGVVPVSFHLDEPGPIARTARDLEFILRCLDPTRDRRPVDRVATPRLGFVEPFFMEQADEAIREATETAVQTLADCGTEIVPFGLPECFADVHRMHRRIMAVEAAAFHRQRFQTHRESYGPAISRMLEEGLSTSGVDYADALIHQCEFSMRISEPFYPPNKLDALIMPATDTTAPASLDTTGDSRFQAPWSYAGLPVVGIPCGLACDGMPAAVQLVGRAHSDFPLLGTARWCQAQLGFDELPPLLR